MQFNQTNNNGGDVNNAISEKGNVIQTTGSGDNAISEKGNAVQTGGTGNKVQVDQPKESFWGTLWKKVKACWMWLVG